MCPDLTMLFSLTIVCTCLLLCITFDMIHFMSVASCRGIVHLVCTTCVAGLLCIHVDFMVVDMPCACCCIHCCILVLLDLLYIAACICVFSPLPWLWLRFCWCTCVGEAVHMGMNTRVYCSHTRLTEFKNLKSLM
jgi:hypothetical protein